MSSNKTKTAKVVAGLLGIGMAFSLFAGVAVPVASAAALTQAQIDAIISLLQSFGADTATVNNVKTSLSGGAPSPAPSPGSYVFATDLKQGSTGADVMNLQKVLNMDPATQVAASGAGSPGNETSYFGPATKAAVIKYQQKNGITPAAGYVGPITRAKLNGTSGPVSGPTPGPTPTPVPAGTGLTVSSPTQPAASLAPQSAARVPFTKFTVTAGSDGDVILNSVTIERGGLGQDANFSGIVLLNENGLQLGIAKTLNSNHQATVGEAVTIPRGTSKTFTVAGNMASSLGSYAGQVVNISVVGVNTSAAVSGSLPITGAAHTINATLSIGSVTTERASLQPTTAVNKEVGVTGFTFSQFKVTAGSVENVRVHSIRWNQASSAGAADLANVVTVVNSVEYPTTISSDGKYYSTVFPGGILIEKGLNKDISLKADVVGGSGRTINFGVEKTTDLYITGETYGYGITPPSTGTGFTSGTIWYPAETITIANGSLTVEKANAVAAQNIAPNLANQVLGGFTTEVKGEPITVASHVFSFATTGTRTAGSSAQITQVTIVDENGSVVAGPVDEVESTGDVTFTDTVLYPIGKKTYTFKGKVGPGFGSDGTVILSTTPSTNWTTVTGQVTGKTITPSTAAVTMNTMTVKTAALTISVSADPAVQTIVAGMNQFAYANILLSAVASGEDLSMSSIPLDYEVTTAADLTSCNLYNGSPQLTSGSNTVNPSGDNNSLSFTFDSPLTLAKGAVTTLTVKCNVPSSITTGSHSFGYNSASSPTVTGKVSGQSATITEVTSAGQTITVTTSGSLTVELSGNSPSYTVVTAGATDQTVSVLRVRATNEEVRLTDLALKLTNAASSSISDLAGGKVTLWNGATKVGETQFTAGNYNTASTTFGTCSGCSDFIVPKNDYRDLTIKADLSAQGTGQPGTAGAFIAVDWEGNGISSTFGGIAGVGSSSGVKALGSGTDTASGGVRVLKSIPTITHIPLPTGTSLTASSDKPLYRFSITASPKGAIGISKLTLRFATSSATTIIDLLDNVNIYAYTNSNFSGPVTGVQTDGRLMATDKPLAGFWASGSTDVEIYPETSGNASTTLEIPASGTRYFEVVGDITLSGAGTTYSVQTQLQGDSIFAADLSENGAATSTVSNNSPYYSYLATSSYFVNSKAGDDDFIWSPFSTSTQTSRLANDYLNGYGLPSLPTTNLTPITLSDKPL